MAPPSQISPLHCSINCSLRGPHTNHGIQPHPLPAPELPLLLPRLPPRPPLLPPHRHHPRVRRPHQQPNVPGRRHLPSQEAHLFLHPPHPRHQAGRRHRRRRRRHRPRRGGRRRVRGSHIQVAAIANLLRFDVYDLELTEVRSNTDLRLLLVGTANGSILVVEDIDCSAELRTTTTTDSSKMDSGMKWNPDSESDKEKVTLSGLLNFVNGLWSRCGDERIIVFTTNHKDRLDPALLRPGRMDMHIHMSYCTPSGFRVLASNYHLIDDHRLFGEIDRLITEKNVTPARIAEELMKSDDAEVALQGLITALNRMGTDMKEREIQQYLRET